MIAMNRAHNWSQKSQGALLPLSNLTNVYRLLKRSKCFPLLSRKEMIHGLWEEGGRRSFIREMQCWEFHMSPSVLKGEGGTGEGRKAHKYREVLRGDRGTLWEWQSHAVLMETWALGEGACVPSPKGHLVGQKHAPQRCQWMGPWRWGRKRCPPWASSYQRLPKSWRCPR